MDPSKIPIRASTQDHLNIEDIQDDLVILKDGSVCLILQAAAVNFGLLSEQEQDATIFSYAGLLNSLTFSIQILIKSQRKDVSAYLKLLKKEEDGKENLVLKERIQKYRHFIESTVRENNVLDKKFYIIIPFSSLELGVKGASGVFKKGLPYPKSYIMEKAKIVLSPKRDHLIRQFNRIGLKIEQLNTKKLIELFFKIYNPDSFGVQIITTSNEYESPLVEAAVVGMDSDLEKKVVSPTGIQPVSPSNLSSIVPPVRPPPVSKDFSAPIPKNDSGLPTNPAFPAKPPINTVFTSVPLPTGNFKDNNQADNNIFKPPSPINNIK